MALISVEPAAAAMLDGREEWRRRSEADAGEWCDRAAAAGRTAAIRVDRAAMDRVAMIDRRSRAVDMEGVSRPVAGSERPRGSQQQAAARAQARERARILVARTPIEKTQGEQDKGQGRRTRGRHHRNGQRLLDSGPPSSAAFERSTGQLFRNLLMICSGQDCETMLMSFENHSICSMEGEDVMLAAIKRISRACGCRFLAVPSSSRRRSGVRIRPVSLCVVVV